MPTARGIAFAAPCAALAVPSAAQAATKTVTMGVPAQDRKAFAAVSGDVNDYFPHTITVRQGDAVRFVPSGFHDADFPARGGAPSAFIRLNGQKVEGAVDAVGAPFWFNGLPPAGINLEPARPNFGRTLTYDGTAAVNRGLPLAENLKPMTVRFPRTGAVRYLCDVHPGMSGVVDVKAGGARVPTAREDARAVRRQVARTLRLARRAALAEPPRNSGSVGVAAPGGVEHFGFRPRRLNVDAGTTVTFKMSKDSLEGHTATTGPGDPAKEPSSFLGALARSIETPAIDPRVIYPSDPPGTVAGLTPALHGNGFWTSGFMVASGANGLPASARVRMAAPGRYTFYCLPHPDMRTTVTVR